MERTLITPSDPPNATSGPSLAVDLHRNSMLHKIILLGQDSYAFITRQQAFIKLSRSKREEIIYKIMKKKNSLLSSSTNDQVKKRHLLNSEECPI